MSTPAINEYATSKVVAHQLIYSGGALWMDIPHEQIFRSREHTRPASVSHPKNSAGWRNPGNWNHYVHESTNAPLNGVISGDPNGPNGNYQMFTDGLFWDNGLFGVPAFPTWLENSAVNKALLKLKNQSVDLSVAFGERKETGELALDAANICVEGIRQALRFKRVGFRAAWSEIKRETEKSLKSKSGIRKYGHDFIDNFLQVQYGLRPLHQDVYGAVSSINESEKDGNPYTARIKSRGRSVDQTIWDRQSGISYCGYKVAVNVVHHVEVALYYECDNPVWKSLSSLGITNPASTAYELLPFSFLLDWFLPVGNYLSAMDAAIGWSFQSGTISTTTRLKASSPAPYMGGQNSLIASFPYTETGVRFQRVVLNESPGPRYPSFKNPLSGQHIANAIALAVASLI